MDSKVFLAEIMLGVEPVYCPKCGAWILDKIKNVPCGKETETIDVFILPSLDKPVRKTTCYDCKTLIICQIQEDYEKAKKALKNVDVL